MSRVVKPETLAARRTAAMQPSSKCTGGLSQILFSVASRPRGSQTSRNDCPKLCSIASSTTVSGCRRSTEKSTPPGTTFRELGNTSTIPTVPTASGAYERAIAWTRSISRAAPSNASLRRFIGVAPVWASVPLIATSNQRTPCTRSEERRVGQECSRREEADDENHQREHE